MSGNDLKPLLRQESDSLFVMSTTHKNVKTFHEAFLFVCYAPCAARETVAFFRSVVFTIAYRRSYAILYGAVTESRLSLVDYLLFMFTLMGLGRFLQKSQKD